MPLKIQNKQIPSPAATERRRSLKRFIADLPQKHIVRAGKVLGILYYALDLPHRRIVRANLEFAFPELSRERIRRRSKAVFQNLGIAFVEICQMMFLSREDILHKFEIRGEEILWTELKKGRGLIIISAHFGNWELAHQFIGCYFGISIVGVVKKIRFKPLDRWLNRFRTRFGNRTVYKKGATEEMRLAMRAGEVVGLLIDQSRRLAGVEVDFFGHRVFATPAAAFLAIRYKCPVLPIFCFREPDGSLVIDVQPPIAIQRTNDLRKDIQVYTQYMSDAVEKMVRRHPEQWFWLHKRWKKFYPDLYPQWQARRRKRKERERRRQEG